MTNQTAPEKYNQSVVLQFCGLALICLLVGNFFSDIETGLIIASIAALGSIALLVWSAVGLKRKEKVLALNKGLMIVNAILGALLVVAIVILSFYSFIFMAAFREIDPSDNIGSTLPLGLLYTLLNIAFAGMIIFTQITHWKRLNK